MIPKAIKSFDGEYKFLSNFFSAEVEFEGKVYPSSEHAYQAAKVLDEEIREEIRTASSASKSKRLGKVVKLRPDWEEVKYDTMLAIVRDKFNRHADLAEQLLATGNAELIEGNTCGDKIWGVYNGEGTNWLGKILMQVRSELDISRKS